MFKSFKRKDTEEIRLGERIKKLKSAIESGTKSTKKGRGFELRDVDLDYVNADYITLSILRALTEKVDPLVQIVLDNAKSDSKFFDEFVNFLERGDKRKIVLRILRLEILKYCRENFSPDEI